MKEQICLITGATDGVGRASAAELARKGFTVVLVARNASKAERVKREIQDSCSSAKVDFIIADFRSLQDVRTLAETFRQRYPRLDVLINNAGIFAPRKELTEDGNELTLQVNYLAPFLLTRLLLDELKKSDQGRIINLSSSVYTAGKLDPRNLQSERKFSTISAYAASKLFMLMFTVELSERLRGTGVTVNAVHPGVVRTQMLATATGVFKLISYLALPFSVSAEEGASTSVYLASSPDVKAISGAYFVRLKATPVKSRFMTKEARDLLWSLSEESVRVGV